MEMWERITKRFKVRRDNSSNEAKTPEENSNILSSLSDFDVTRLSEEEISTLRDVFERQWVLQERNAEEKRKLEQEIKEMESQITQKSRGLSRKALSDLCATCFKVKVATTAALVCSVCRKKTCTRCGKRDQGTWKCALCRKKRELFKFSGSWHSDVELYERSQVQEMLNRLAEESVRRMEMASYNTQQETVRISTPAQNSPLLNHPPTIQAELQLPFKPHMTTGNETKLPNRENDLDEYDDDDDVFEDYNDGSDNYLNFPHEEEHRRQDGSGYGDSYSSVHYSSLDDESNFFAETRCPSPDDLSPTEDAIVEPLSPRRKDAVFNYSKQRNCPLIHKVALQKDSDMSGEFGSGAEFGIQVVGGRMCTGGFNGVYVAKVMRGLSAEQCIGKGDQVLEWNHTSMVDVTFEKVRSIVAESPQELTLVLCHNAVSFTDSRAASRERISAAIEERKDKKISESVKYWSRWSLTQLMENEDPVGKGTAQSQVDQKKTKQIQLHLWHDPHGNNLVVRVINARGLSLHDMPSQELPNPYVLLYLLPNREISSHFRTNTDQGTVTPKWELSFVFSNIPESELGSRTLEVTLWSEDQKERNVFIGEVVLKLTPELLNSGAQWYDLVDHDASTSFLPVPMPRRHSLGHLDPEKETIGFPWDINVKARKYSSTVNISMFSRIITPSSVVNTENDDSALCHKKQRRANSVVTMEAFRPRKKPGINRGSLRRKFLESCKCSSEPVTPSVSIPTSVEDLRKTSGLTRSTTNIIKSPLQLSEFLASFKSAQDSAKKQEREAKVEKEGKIKGALGAVKKYPSNLRIRLSRLTIRQSPQEGCSPTESRGSTTKCYDPPRCESAPATPSITKSAEDIRRERSLTNYLQVPPSPGVLAAHLRRFTTPPVSENEELGFNFPEPDTQPGNMDGQEVLVKEGQSAVAEAQNEEGHFLLTSPRRLPLDNVAYASCSKADDEHQIPHIAISLQSSVNSSVFQSQGASQESLPSESVAQASGFSTNDERQIPFIAIHPANSASDGSEFGESSTEHNEPEAAVEPEPEPEPPAEKKGTMHALRKYSRSFMPRSSSLKSSDKLSRYGEDPVKGVIGPGQMRRGSYQGHELGYMRIGLLLTRGTLEVEIIRGVSLMAPGDHPPDTYVKTYLIQEQIRLLKRKTPITRQSVNPVYNCKIKYPGRDLRNKELMVICQKRERVLHQGFHTPRSK